MYTAAVPPSPVPSINIHFAPNEEFVQEPPSPFKFSSQCADETLLSPPGVSVVKKPKSPTGLERAHFELLLRHSRERTAAARGKQDLRKEVGLKTHQAGQFDRRARFLAKLITLPSPTATSTPVTPPESPSVFNFSLPSPGLTSPLALFETLDFDVKREGRHIRTEKIDFKAIKERDARGLAEEMGDFRMGWEVNGLGADLPDLPMEAPPPLIPTRHNQGMPSLAQIGARLAPGVVPPAQPSSVEPKVPIRGSRLPAFLSSAEPKAPTPSSRLPAFLRRDLKEPTAPASPALSSGGSTVRAGRSFGHHRRISTGSSSTLRLAFVPKPEPLSVDVVITPSLPEEKEEKSEREPLLAQEFPRPKVAAPAPPVQAPKPKKQPWNPGFSFPAAAAPTAAPAPAPVPTAAPVQPPKANPAPAVVPKVNPSGPMGSFSMGKAPIGNGSRPVSKPMARLIAKAQAQAAAANNGSAPQSTAVTGTAPVKGTTTPANRNNIPMNNGQNATGAGGGKQPFNPTVRAFVPRAAPPPAPAPPAPAKPQAQPYAAAARAPAPAPVPRQVPAVAPVARASPPAPPAILPQPATTRGLAPRAPAAAPFPALQQKQQPVAAAAPAAAPPARTMQSRDMMARLGRRISAPARLPPSGPLGGNVKLGMHAHPVLAMPGGF